MEMNEIVIVILYPLAMLLIIAVGTRTLLGALYYVVHFIASLGYILYDEYIKRK